VTSMDVITIAQGVKHWQHIPGSHLYARIIRFNVTVHPRGGPSIHDCDEVLITVSKEDAVPSYANCSRKLFEMGWMI
jgi:hypothetical protein